MWHQDGHVHIVDAHHWPGVSVFAIGGSSSRIASILSTVRSSDESGQKSHAFFNTI